MSIPRRSSLYAFGWLGILAVACQPAGAYPYNGYLEITVLTDKSVYRVDEEVQVRQLITNCSDGPIGIETNWQPGFDVFAYENSAGLDRTELWMTQKSWQAAPFGKLAGGAYYLVPGHWLEFEYTPWDLDVPAIGLELETEEYGIPSPGEYDLLGVMYGAVVLGAYDVVYNDAHITVLAEAPEPGTVLLFLGGGVPLLMKQALRGRAVLHPVSADRGPASMSQSEGGSR